MERHQASGRRGLGIALASCTMLVWSVLPLALEGLLAYADPVTIIWFRFLVAAVVLGGILAARGALPALRNLDAAGLALLAIATVFLAANYYSYLAGLARTNAASAQVLIQLAPLLLAIGGVFVFRESFTRLQWLGLTVLLCGLLTFFSAQLRALAHADAYLAGTGLIVVAAITWAIYGLAQKQLLALLPSQGIMVCLYAGCALLFALGATPSLLANLDGVGWFMMVWCAASTLVAYGTFAASLEHWEASRVSAVLALTPLGTLLWAFLAAALWPEHFDSTALSTPAVIGALVVVMGSALVSLGGRANPAR